MEDSFRVSSLKWLILGVSFVLTSILLGGCAEEAPQEEPLLRVGSNKTECLREAPQFFGNFLQGSAQTSEIDSFFKCTHEAVDLFSTYVKKGPDGVYEKERLKIFLEDYFLGSARLTDTMLLELMRVKSLFVGGSNESLRDEELPEIHIFLNELKTFMRAINPYMVWLNQEVKKGSYKGDRQPVIDFLTVLSHQFQPFVNRLSRREEPYYFKDLATLLVEAQNLLSQEPIRSQTELAPRELVNLLARLKGLFVGGGVKKIDPSEWSDFSRAGFKAYGVWLKWKRWVRPQQDWREEEGVKALRAVWQELRSLIKEGLQQRQPGERYFSNREMGELLRSVAMWVDEPEGLSPELFEEAWYLVSGKLLPALVRDWRTGRFSEAPGFLPVHLEALNQEIEVWLQSQVHLLAWWRGEDSEWPDDPWVEEGVEETLDFARSSRWPLKTDGQGRLVIGPETEWSVKDLTLLNATKSLIRFVMRAYVDKEARQRFSLGVTRKELSVAFLDLKPFAVALGMIGPDNTTFDARLYREGNLFLPHSNGDNLLQLEEGVEYLLYVLSGMEARRVVLSDARQNCTWSEHDRAVVGVECFRSRLQVKFDSFFSHLPEMVSFVRSMEHREWVKFENNLEITVREKGVSLDPFLEGDVVEMMILLQYIETLMKRADVNENNTLSTREVVRFGFPLFERYLTRLIGLPDREFVLDVFTYLLKYKSIPLPPYDGPLDPIRFRHWQRFPERWNLEVDRSDIAEILSLLNRVSP